MGRCVSSRLVAAVGFVAFLAAMPATAGPFAYVWANQPVADFYFPSEWTASNPGGGVPTITRSGLGEYAVRFGGLDRVGVGGGNVQVTANGFRADRCKVTEWIGATVYVSCFDEVGIAVDSQFLLLVTRAEADTPGLAYAWADLPASPSYTPNVIYTYNAGGGPVEVVRTGAGAYTITFGGLDEIGADGGNVIATAYGAGSHFCKLANWSAGSASVRCYDTNGAAADSQFSVLFNKPVGEAADLFYVWADEPEAGDPYAPDPVYAYDPSGGPMSVSRVETGTYRVTFPGLDELTVPSDGHLQVTAYGGGSQACNSGGWSGETVTVRCWDGAGLLADSRFSALFVAPEAGGVAGAITVLGALRLLARRAPSGRA